MNTKLLLGIAAALILPPAALILAQQAGAARSARPEGPCDIYAAANTPCTAAHSSTRALYAAYNGPLYQVMRQSDGKTLDITPVQSSASDPGGYADAPAQDAFCANTYCWITTLYDQSGHNNNLVQPPHGGFSGPAMGGFNNIPVADMAPVTLMGHKVYGVFIAPGMGLRWNDAHGTAVDDQAEGQYWVLNGRHFNNGCCFDYGNAETDSRDDGNGTMETTYYGNSTGWYHGPPPGPWIMTDQENNLVGCVNPDGSKNCDLPSINWRFVTAMADGEPHHWRSMGGDAQSGQLQTMFDGPRVNNSYDPMRKQGAILLGNGGDNSNGSQGTFYEGAMTAAGTFPSADTNQKLQANIVAAHYDVPRLTLAPAAAINTPPGLQTFHPGAAQETTLSFTNTTGAPVTLRLGLAHPKGWTSDPDIKMFDDPIAPNATATATFKITADTTPFNGDLVGVAAWKSASDARSETTSEKVRNTPPISINEFAINSNSPPNPTNSFIELFNAGDTAIDLSNWSLTQHPTQQPIFSAIQIPAGTRIAPHNFYLLGLSTSGLAAPAKKGDSVLYVRSTAGLNVGDSLEIDTGTTTETRKITAVGTPAANPALLWQPLPDGPVITIPPGSTSVPVSSVMNVTPGQKIALGHGATFPAVSRSTEQLEIVTVTEVGKPGTQATLAANAKAGDTAIKVTNANNLSPGDKIRLDIDSKDHGIETVTIKSIDRPAPPASAPATGRGGRGGRGGVAVNLDAPLKFDHASNMPFSDRGTGISFQPATAVAHASNEPVQPLGTGITLDQPLANDHPIHAALRNPAATAEGYQGTVKPNQWFGGPALTAAGNMVLRDADGRVVDSLNYGSLVDPWAAEGYHTTAGAGRGACIVPAPVAGRGGRGGNRGAPAPATTSAPALPDRSAARTSDGADTDSNCTDFHITTPTPGAPNTPAQ